jgi:hypothetical protein
MRVVNDLSAAEIAVTDVQVCLIVWGFLALVRTALNVVAALAFAPDI